MSVWKRYKTNSKKTSFGKIYHTIALFAHIRKIAQTRLNWIDILFPAIGRNDFIGWRASFFLSQMSLNVYVAPTNSEKQIATKKLMKYTFPSKSWWENIRGIKIIMFLIHCFGRRFKNKYQIVCSILLYSISNAWIKIKMVVIVR